MKDSGRAEYIVATDEEALRGFRILTQKEGIIPGKLAKLALILQKADHRFSLPALESAHAVWGTIQLAKTLPKEANIVMVSSVFTLFSAFETDLILFLLQCLSGRGDKDVEQISQMLPKWADKLDWHIALPK